MVDVVAKLWTSLYLGVDGVIRSFRGLSVPTTPAMLATAVDFQSIDLTIVTPSTIAGNAPVYGYKFYRIIGGNWIPSSSDTVDITSSASTFTVSPLAPSTQYSFRCEAVSAEGFSSTPSSTVVATTPAVVVGNTEPRWIDGLPDVYNLLEGQAFDYTFTATDPDVGDLIDITAGAHAAGINVEIAAQVGTERSIRLWSAGLTASMYSVTVDLSSANNALADWLLRSGEDPAHPQPGVKWALRFNTYESVAKGVNQGGRDITHPINTTRWNPTGGIMGDGCLEVWTPEKNTYPYEAGGQWHRPIACFPGDRGYASEVNAYKAGQEVFDLQNSSSTNFLGGEWAGGFYAHPDYRTGGAQQKSWADQLIGTANDGVTEFYLQFRVKFSANRFAGTYDGSSGIRIPGSKFFRVEGRCTATPHQEIVMTGSTSAWNWTPRFTMYSGTTWPGMHIYGEQGNSTSDAQPGNEHGYVCNYNTNPKFKDCWNWTPYADQWMTILLKVKMGHHTPPVYTDTLGRTWDAQGVSSQQDGWLANSPYKDTAIAVWIAPFGGTYEKIWDKSDYIYWFDGNYPTMVRLHTELGTTATPWGWNWIRFDAFTGGTNAVPSDQEYFHWFDQVIFSTQFIPCPAV